MKVPSAHMAVVEREKITAYLVRKNAPRLVTAYPCEE